MGDECLAEEAARTKTKDPGSKTWKKKGQKEKACVGGGA